MVGEVMSRVLIVLLVTGIVIIIFGLAKSGYNNFNIQNQSSVIQKSVEVNSENVMQNSDNEFIKVNVNYTKSSSTPFMRLKTMAGSNSSDDLKIMLNFPVIPSYYGLDSEFIEVGNGAIIADDTGIYVYVNTLSENDIYDNVGWILKFDQGGNLIWSYVTSDDGSKFKKPIMFQDNEYIYIVGRRVSDDKILFLKIDKNSGFGRYEAILVSDTYPSKTNGLRKGLTLYGTDAYKYVNGHIKVLLQPYVMIDFTNRSIEYIYDQRYMKVDPKFTTYTLFKMVNGREVVLRHQTKVTNGNYDILVRVYDQYDVAKDFYFFGTKYNDFILTRWPIVDNENIFVMPAIIKIPQTSGYFTLLAFSKLNGSLIWSKTYVLPMDEAGITPVWFDSPTEKIYKIINDSDSRQFNYNIIDARVVGDVVEYTILVSRDSVKTYYEDEYVYKETYTSRYDPYVNAEFYPPAHVYYRDIIYKLRINVSNGNVVSLVNSSSISYYNVGAVGLYFNNVINTPGSIYDYYVDRNGKIYILYILNKRVYIVKTSLERTSLYNIVYRTYPISYGLGKPNNFATINVKLISASEG